MSAPPEDWREAMFGCERWLGQFRPQTAAQALRAAADALSEEERADRYGEGPIVYELEREVAALLAFDILQLGALLAATGGLNNPFALLILAPVAIAASILGARSALVVGLLTLAVGTQRAGHLGEVGVAQG